MDAIEALLTRRSVRQFTSEPVTEDQVNSILCAAMYAPSACNQQPWHFILVSQRERLDEIARRHPFSKMLHQAPLAVIVCGDTSLETCRGYWSIDCSAAMENLLLATHALGLGGVWVGVYPVEERVKEISQLLGLPSFAIPLGIAAIGHPLEPLPTVNRFKPERIHHQSW